MLLTLSTLLPIFLLLLLVVVFLFLLFLLLPGTPFISLSP
uniref:Uncharacterized protein n=1 Tax=Rhizophora mucronata TaxID=61149 RepID=A0A2P2JKY1_RHIMU